MGGGDTPSAGALDARKEGINVRVDMDNPIFAVNDFAVNGGLDVAYVDHGFTAQAEATVGQLWRVRGAQNQQEADKAVLTSGVHIGYFLAPLLSLGAELRYQYWINAPASSRVVLEFEGGGDLIATRRSASSQRSAETRSFRSA